MQSCWLTPESRPTATQIYLTLADLLQVFTVCKAQNETGSITDSQESRESFDTRWNSLKPNFIKESEGAAADTSSKAGSKPTSPSLNNLIGSLEDMNGSRASDEYNANSVLLPAQSSQKFEFKLGPQSKDRLDSDSLNDSMIFTRRSSSSETEEENWKRKIERGVYTEKVRQKSRSVTDLMVLTHIDYSESESETPQPSLDHRVNYKNVRLATKPNLDTAMSYVHGSEGNLLSVQDDFQAELRKLQEEHRDSLFFVPDKYSRVDSKDEQINNNVDQNHRLIDSSSERLLKELNSTSELKPSNQVYNVFSVTIDNVSPVHVVKLNEIINLEEPKTFVPYEVPKLCDIISNNSIMPNLQRDLEIRESFVNRESYSENVADDTSSREAFSRNLKEMELQGKDDRTNSNNSESQYENDDESDNTNLNHLNVVLNCRIYDPDGRESKIEDKTLDDVELIESDHKDAVKNRSDVDISKTLEKEAPNVDESNKPIKDRSEAKCYEINRGIYHSDSSNSSLIRRDVTEREISSLNVALESISNGPEANFVDSYCFLEDQCIEGSSESLELKSSSKDSMVEVAFPDVTVVDENLSNSNTESSFETKLEEVCTCNVQVVGNKSSEDIRNDMYHFPNSPKPQMEMTFVTNVPDRLEDNLREDKVNCDDKYSFLTERIGNHSRNFWNEQDNGCKESSKEFLDYERRASEFAYLEYEKKISSDLLPQTPEISIAAYNETSCQGELEELKSSNKKVQQVPKLIALIENNDKLMEYIIANYESEFRDDFSCNKSHQSNSSRFPDAAAANVDDTTPSLNCDKSNRIPIVDFDISNNQDSANPNSLTHLNAFSSLKTKHLSMGFVASTPTKSARSSMRTEGADLNYSIETWDNFLGKAIDSQNRSIGDQTFVFESLEPRSLMFLGDQEGRSVTTTHPNSDTEETILETKEEATVALRTYDMVEEELNETNATYGAGELNSTFTRSEGRSVTTTSPNSDTVETSMEAEVEATIALREDVVDMNGTYDVVQEEFNETKTTYDQAELNSTFTRSEGRTVTITPPNSDSVETSLEAEVEATISLSGDVIDMDRTYDVVKEELNETDATYDLAELNSTFTRSGDFPGNWESSEGWFLHPQSSVAISEKLAERKDKDNYVRFEMDEEILTALRGELMAKLPHAQGISSDKVKENEDDWDTSEKDEVFLRYNVYNTPLSPIPEESDTEEYENSVCSSPVSLDSCASDDWPEKFLDGNAIAAAQDAGSQSLKAQGGHRHTSSQDSCCSNDTLFNLEDMTCIDQRDEGETKSKVKPAEMDTSDDRLRTEAINYFKYGTALGVGQESPLMDSPMEQVSDKTYLIDFLVREREQNEMVSVVVTEPQLDCQSDSNSSKSVPLMKNNVAPLPSPDDHPWKQLSNSLLSFDRSQKKAIFDLDCEESGDSHTTYVNIDNLGNDDYETNEKACGDVLSNDSINENYLARVNENCLTGVSEENSETIIENVHIDDMRSENYPECENVTVNEINVGNHYGKVSVNRYIDPCYENVKVNEWDVEDCPVYININVTHSDVENRPYYVNLNVKDYHIENRPYYENVNANNCDIANRVDYEYDVNDRGIVNLSDYESINVCDVKKRYDYESINVNYRDIQNHPDYESANVNDRDVVNCPDYESVNLNEPDLEKGPDNENVMSLETCHETVPNLRCCQKQDGEGMTNIYDNIKNLENMINEEDYVSITNFENCKMDVEFDKTERLDVDETITQENMAEDEDLVAEEHKEEMAKDDSLFGVLTDIRFSGPGGEPHLMSTSFSESNNDEKDWDSGSDTRSSSSGEFIWKLDAEPKEGHLEETSGESSCSDDEGECPEFIPSAWDKYATPTKSAMRSPEKTLEKEEKKGVWFKKQRYHCVYEYPREPESPVLQSFDLWNNTPPATSYTDWYFDIDSGSDFSEFTGSNLQDTDTLSTDFSIGFNDEFYVTSSATPFDMMTGSTSQFFPGDHWSDASKLTENTTPDSGVEDATPGSLERIDLAGIETSSSVEIPSLKLLAEAVHSKSKLAEESPSNEILGGLRHTRDRLKLDLPISPNNFTANKSFSLEPAAEPVVLRERPSFTTFGKSRFLVQHVDTPDRDPAGKNVCFEALPYKPLETQPTIDNPSKRSKISEEMGEASLLDSADEDSGIESSTLERRSVNVNAKLIDDL
ncbi:hypothetical protein WA026_020990 [Henosepilachna vigintioctopunctata]|uniref:Serine-threonine/tyrosine-protein kinase catalytic domain-containing protein n=1 Tax=Henosepilachna vigintioctopunctata TaxID=420089 RepID=A0AAW1VIY7_9CUCU